jgi:hypothetical protein
MLNFFSIFLENNLGDNCGASRTTSDAHINRHPAFPHTHKIALGWFKRPWLCFSSSLVSTHHQALKIDCRPFKRVLVIMGIIVRE